MKTVDFFGRQRKARRNTAVLVILFVLAIAVMIAGLYAATIALLLYHQRQEGNFQWLRLDVLMLVSAATLAIVALGSLYKTWSLRRGGEQVAILLGGRLVPPGTTQPAERRLQNIVEEMALASGVAVPPVYVLSDEDSINAFAAGLTPDDAVIAVSRGAMELLNRDELQGVIAHEYSHILNGDMRFNLRLIGLLHGILVVGLIGYYVLRFGGGSRSGGSRSGGSRRGKGAAQILLFGLAVMVIGYVGLFFGRLIKAAVSRQREYLADASAVQFTRNPQGIAGALKKIGGLSSHSYIQSPAAETASHMYFGASVARWSFSPLNTHPPLARRIQAIDPDFDGQFARIERPVPRRAADVEKPDEPAASQPPPGALETLFPGLGFDEKIPIDPAVVVAAVGAPTARHADYSAQLIAKLPDSLERAAREPFSARCVAFALLLDQEGPTRQRQLAMLREQEETATVRETERLAALLRELSETARPALIEIVQGTLRQLSEEQYARFRRRILDLIKADQKVDLFEFVVHCVVIHHLDRIYGLAQPPRTQYYGIRGVTEELAVVLSALAHVGQRDADAAAQVYRAATAPLKLDTLKSSFLARSDCSLAALKSSLESLATCSMPIKKRILSVATLCVAADGQVTVEEAELLRAVASSLDCPMPPILPGPLRK